VFPQRADLHKRTPVSTPHPPLRHLESELANALRSSTFTPPAGAAQDSVQTVGDAPLGVVGGVLVVQGGPGAGVPGPLHHLGQGGPGARGERHRRVALVVPGQVVSADGSTGSREHRRSAAARERGANSEHQDLSKAGPPQTVTLRSMQAVSVPAPAGVRAGANTTGIGAPPTHKRSQST